MVGVLKTASLKLAENSSKEPKAKEVTYSTLESPRKKIALQKIHAQNSQRHKKVMSFAVPREKTLEMVESRSSIPKKIKPMSLRSPVSRGKESKSIDISKRGGEIKQVRSSSVQHESRFPKNGGHREALNDQDVLAATQFTEVELNRIITNVGGGYLIKKNHPKAGGKPQALTENLEHYCYLGFDKLLSKTKKQRNDLRVSHLVS